jgi:hypothetical protein
MNPNGINQLIGQLEKTLRQLDRMSDYYKEFRKDFLDDYSKKYDLVILSDIVTDYYTCLETAFMRISKYFENNLEQDRWHKHLLEKMTYEVPGIRNAVLTDKTYQILDEFLRFRHFKRYYYNYDYDRDKMDFLEKKYKESLPLVKSDIKSFIEFLRSLSE